MPEENSKSDLMRFKRFKDMDNWSVEDPNEFKFPTFKYKHGNTPLLDFLHSHGFVVEITHIGAKNPRVERYPNETGNSFHVLVDKKLTEENFKEYVEELEGIEEGDEYYQETLNGYKDSIGTSLINEDAIEFHFFFPVSPNQITNPLFKEECLKRTRQELSNMLKTKIISEYSDSWNYSDANAYQKSFIDFMNIQNVYVRSNKEIPTVFNTDERLYLNSKVLRNIGDNNLMDILEEFMKL